MQRGKAATGIRNCHKRTPILRSPALRDGGWTEITKENSRCRIEGERGGCDGAEGTKGTEGTEGTKGTKGIANRKQPIAKKADSQVGRKAME